MTVKTLYRYEAVRYSFVIDAEMEVFGVSKARLELHEYVVVAETPKGYWITFASGSKDKWVSKTSRKRFAHTTKDEARESYRRRKLAFVGHAQRRLKRAKEDLAL